jgi:hypothetical protein
MKCCDVERVLPELLEGEPDRRLQIAGETRPTASEIEAHLKGCPACSELVSDLKLIANQARQLAASEEPAPGLWVRIAAELRAEGLVSDAATREPEPEPMLAPTRALRVPSSPRSRWSPRWLVPVAAALVVAASYVVSHKPAPQIAQQPTPATPVASPARMTPPTTSSVPGTPAVTSASAPAPSPQQLAEKSAGPTETIRPAAEPEPSEEDRQFLSVVSTRAPSMRATYENQLKAVNADIRETQAYVERNPADADARQHLMDAYQQKALLYEIALDRIQ